MRLPATKAGGTPTASHKAIAKIRRRNLPHIRIPLVRAALGRGVAAFIWIISWHAMPVALMTQAISLGNAKAVIHARRSSKITASVATSSTATSQRVYSHTTPGDLEISPSQIKSRPKAASRHPFSISFRLRVRQSGYDGDTSCSRHLQSQGSSWPKSRVRERRQSNSRSTIADRERPL